MAIVRRFPAGPILRDVSELTSETVSSEPAVGVDTARVVVANYGAILHDFAGHFGPSFADRYADHYCEACRKSGRLCRRAVDRWLLNHAAFVSRQQTLPNSVNSAIEVSGREITAYRPPRYGRALVVRVEESPDGGPPGLLDIKGAGLAPGITPLRAAYSDGLEYLGVALGDFFYAWLIDRIFERTVPGYCTVPVYAVVDLGFDIVGGWHGTGPAGLHVRRAHAREEKGLQLAMSGSDEERVRIQMELILRSFGMTTASAGSSYKGAKVDGRDVVIYSGRILTARNEQEEAKLAELVRAAAGTRLEHPNIQLTRDKSWTPRVAQMFDFGHIHVHRRFRSPLVLPARDALYCVRRIVHPGDPGFPQPRPEVALDGELFSRTSVNAYAFYAAQAFRNGRMNQRQIGLMLRRAIARTRV